MSDNTIRIEDISVAQSVDGVVSLPALRADGELVKVPLGMIGGSEELSVAMRMAGEWSRPQDANGFFYGKPYRDRIVIVPELDFSKTTSSYGIFKNCTNMKTVYCKYWDMSKIANMGYIFYGCSSLTSLDVGSWDVSSANNMEMTFAGCRNLTSLDVSTWNVSNVTNFVHTFSGCKKLNSLDVRLWNVEKVKSISYIFYHCDLITSLNVKSWDISALKDMSFAFSNTGVIELDLGDWNTANVENYRAVFASCAYLTTLNLSNWDMGRANTTQDLFGYCRRLTTVIGPILNIKTNIDLIFCPLTRASAMVFINGLYDYSTEGGEHTIRFSTITNNVITDDDRAMITNKGWTIV